MKSYHSSIQASLNSQQITMAPFVIWGVSPAIKVWGGVGNITVGSDTFTGVGSLLDLGEIFETTETRVTYFSGRLSGIPSELLSVGEIQSNYNGKALTIYVGFFSGGSLIHGLIPIFSGITDSCDLEVGPTTATVEVNASNTLSLWERSNLSKYTDAEQKRLYPGDLGLQYVAGVATSKFKWGGA